MIISPVITRSGAVSFIVRKIAFATKSQTLYVIILSVMTANLSAFINSVGVLALMMPVAIRSSLKAKRLPSLVLMPIALASAMGGLITMIVTPPNLLISFYREKLIGRPFAIFNYAYVGFFVTLAGVLFIALIGWRLLPKKRKGAKQAEDLFQVQDYMAEIKISKESSVIGNTVRDFEKLIDADFNLISLIRNKKKYFSPPPISVQVGP